MSKRGRDLVLMAADGVIVLLAAWVVTAAGFKLEWHPIYLRSPSPFRIALIVSLLVVTRNLVQLVRRGEASCPGIEMLTLGWEFLRSCRPHPSTDAPRRAV